MCAIIFQMASVGDDLDEKIDFQERQRDLFVLLRPTPKKPPQKATSFKFIDQIILSFGAEGSTQLECLSRNWIEKMSRKIQYTLVDLEKKKSEK